MCVVASEAIFIPKFAKRFAEGGVPKLGYCSGIPIVTIIRETYVYIYIYIYIGSPLFMENYHLQESFEKRRKSSFALRALVSWPQAL